MISSVEACSVKKLEKIGVGELAHLLEVIARALFGVGEHGDAEISNGAEMIALRLGAPSGETKEIDSRVWMMLSERFYDLRRERAIVDEELHLLGDRVGADEGEEERKEERRIGAASKERRHREAQLLFFEFGGHKAEERFKRLFRGILEIARDRRLMALRDAKLFAEEALDIGKLGAELAIDEEGEGEVDHFLMAAEGAHQLKIIEMSPAVEPALARVINKTLGFAAARLKQVEGARERLTALLMLEPDGGLDGDRQRLELFTDEGLEVAQLIRRQKLNQLGELSFGALKECAEQIAYFGCLHDK